MRSTIALGIIALLACNGDPATSPTTQAVAAARKSASLALPSATDPSVSPLFICGPSYPADGGVIEGFCNTLTTLWFQPSGKNKWAFAIRIPGSDAPPPVPPEEDFTEMRFGVFHGAKPIFHHDGIYQFDALGVEIVGGRRYLEMSVRDGQPVNWGVFETVF
jgi:hypothetical protein